MVHLGEFLEYLHLLTKFWDSRHLQLAKYTVFDEESDFQVKNEQIRRPEAKTEEKLLQKIYVCSPLSLTSFSNMHCLFLIGSRPR